MSLFRNFGATPPTHPKPSTLKNSLTSNNIGKELNSDCTPLRSESRISPFRDHITLFVLVLNVVCVVSVFHSNKKKQFQSVEQLETPRIEMMSAPPPHMPPTLPGANGPSYPTYTAPQDSTAPSNEAMLFPTKSKTDEDPRPTSAGTEDCGVGDTSTNGAVAGGNTTVASNTLASSEADTTTVLSGEEDEEDGSEYSEPIKLFVGQVPKGMEEPDLFPIFERYGPMEDVVIIRDRHTGQHRGCAFVTYMGRESAEACVKELHNQYVLEGGRRPLQVRPAGRKEVENKVFVGMLPPNVEEELVKELFSPFGEITGIFMIRTNEGVKKGCAFVKYTERAAAISAIQNMHGQVTVEGSNRPLIVKFADTKSQKRTRMQLNRIENTYMGAMSSQGSTVPYYVPGPSPQYHHVPYPGHATPPPPHSITVTSPSDQSQSAASHFSAPPEQYATYHQSHHSMMYNPYAPPPTDSSYIHERPPTAQSDAMNPRPREGPAGANLFIYHLPHDLTDADLATAFNPFGNVISAKVYVDRYTGESKGFGFVSYDSVISAEHAIEQMNGFQIGSKRLKVQHKRVNHRPQAPVPGSFTGEVYTGEMYSGDVASYHYPESLPPIPPQHIIHAGVPPSIEISGDQAGVDMSAHGSSTQNDIDTITSNFEVLQTE